MGMGESLKGKTAIVTGGNVRVGASICRELAKAGANVAIHYRSHPEEAEALREELEGLDVKAGVFQCDLADPHAAEALFVDVEESMGSVSILVNNAGAIASTPIDRLAPVNLEPLFRINTFAAMYTMSALARRSPVDGAVVNIVDTSVERAWKGHAAYCGSKAALLSISLVAAHELAPTIRVNVVNPGTVALREEELAVVDGITERIPLNRIGEPKDIASAVVYLVVSPYVSGAVLAVDGGSRLF